MYREKAATCAGRWEVSGWVLPVCWAVFGSYCEMRTCETTLRRIWKVFYALMPFLLLNARANAAPCCNGFLRDIGWGRRIVPEFLKLSIPYFAEATSQSGHASLRHQPRAPVAMAPMKAMKAMKALRAAWLYEVVRVCLMRSKMECHGYTVCAHRRLMMGGDEGHEGNEGRTDCWRKAP